MMIGRTRIDNKSALYGMVAMLGLCVIPKVSDIVSPIVTKIRNIIGGNK